MATLTVFCYERLLHSSGISNTQKQNLTHSLNIFLLPIAPAENWYHELLQPEYTCKSQDT